MKTNRANILITGAGGWLGSELTEQLLEKGENVKAINFIYTEKLKQLKEKYKDSLTVIIGDICDKELISSEMQGIKTVFHLAAKVHSIPTNQREEDDFFKVNTIASEEIFKQCMENKVERVIFFSTVSVYKETNEKITLETPKEPLTAYGKSKLKAEQIAEKMYKEQQLPVTIIEPVTVYGEGDVGNFKKLEDMIQKGVCIRFGDGENKKTVIYYKDLIRMVMQIAEDNSKIGKTVICGTEVLSINEINKILIQKAGKKVFKLTVPTTIAKLIIKLCSFAVLKKIKRKVMALMQNNEFEIENKLENYMTFEKYEVG